MGFLTVFSFALIARADLPPTAECRDFMDFSTGAKSDSAYVTSDRGALPNLKTTSVAVSMGGKTQYQWFDSISSADRLHVLWSATKTVTVTLLGRTIAEGKLFNGKPVSLDSKLSEFFPLTQGEDLNTKRAQFYNQVTLENLADMSANFAWNEFYDNDLSASTFMPMLYVDGQIDMAAFARKQPMNPEGPGQRWVYSGGNMNILMAVLKRIWGSEYPQMPNKLLFHPLGIRGAKFEMDPSGTFVGSSYLYLKSSDMIKLGEFFLREQKQENLLPRGWMRDAVNVNPSVQKTNTKADYIKLLGAASSRMFWLNQDIIQDGRLVYEREMPQAPSSMYFAAGHYGQLIIMIPEYGIVIARTGYDLKYWDHIQPLTVKALKCLVPGYQENKGVSLIPPSAGPRRNKIQKVLESIKDAPGLMASVRFLNEHSIPASLIAKEMCSFLYVAGNAQAISLDVQKSTYFERSGLPGIAQKILVAPLKISINSQDRSVTVEQYEERPHDLYGSQLSIVARSVAKLGQSPDQPMQGCLLQRQDVSAERSPYSH